MDRILAQDQLGGFGSEHDNYRGFFQMMKTYPIKF